MLLEENLIFIKKQVALMQSDDEWIEVEVDDKWHKRLRFSLEAKELRKEKLIFKIRVIKRVYKYTDINHLMSSM